ncbi:hypothetical protein KW846_06445 [Pseudomonas sp. PDM32]|uniref:RCC1 domain-containing protein n=1 Tax=Pseudomonas sp. PDM32 TaxID=2854768 RepID=UPI001C45CA25|nr:hypothetical protein [Pseudomonas sp. PDM32]MBV7572327.1 hypothetical protein [Pseudomonas sp. PDM32]
MPSPSTVPDKQTIAPQARLETFPPPRVDLAPEGVLDPEVVPSRGCPLVVPYLDTLDKDRVTYRWSSSVAGGSDIGFKILTVDNAGHEVEFEVLKQYVTASRYRTVTVDYYITRNNSIIGYSEPLILFIGDATLAFDPPRLDGADGPLIDLAVIARELEACLDADEYRLNVGDSGDIRLMNAKGGVIASEPFVVEEGQQGRDKWIALPRDVFLANVGQTVRLDCTVLRADGTREESRVAAFDVRHSIGSGRLKVMGARSRGGCHLISGSAFWLTALDATTLQPIEARWRYNHETTVTSGLRFRDTQQDRPLHVQVDDDWVTIRQRNLMGNGNLISGMNANNVAFAARADLGNLVAWGNAGRGGNLGPNLPELTDIVALSPCGYAFAARRTNDSVVAWGYASYGGQLPTDITPLKDIVAVTGNGYAFVALRANGSIVAWGRADSGAAIPDEIKLLTNIKTVVGSLHAFAALLADGSVVAWGSPTYGGTVPNAIAEFKDIVELTGNHAAFAARRTDGTVVAWGNVAFGGTVPTPIAELIDIVEVSSSRHAFAVRREDGSVMAWGNSDYGGSVPGPIADRKDIVSVTGNNGAFVALLTDGSIRAWGVNNNGGSLPDPISEMTDIVQVVPAAHAFAALSADGSVVAWGNAAYGGSIPDEIATQLTDVRAIYGNTHAFAALTTDGRVVTWGAAAGGGDSSSVAEKLNGKISYEISPAPSQIASRHTKPALVSSNYPEAVTQ